MIRKQVLNNIVMKSPGHVKLLSIINDNEGEKILLQNQQKSGGQEESDVLLGKKIEAIIGGRKYGKEGGCERELGTNIRID